MRIIGITGSLASGKTSASKILSARRWPLFNADSVVKKLYKRLNFQKLIKKKLNLKNYSIIKKEIIKKILQNNSNIKKIEKIIHPFVRREMKIFLKKNRGKKFIFLEIPLLIENNLMNYFDVVIFIKASKDLRLKRFKFKGGTKKLFNILNNKQLSDRKKIKFCDHVIVNEKNLTILKKNLLDIFKKYE